MSGDDLFWMIFLKGFALVAFLGVVRLLAMAIRRYLPEGRLKRILFSPLPGHRKR